MSFDSLLRHRVTIRRLVSTAPDAEGDDYGHGSSEPDDIETMFALIQPKPARSGGGPPEEPTTHYAGTQITDHTVFMRATDVTAADQLYAEDAGPYTGKTFEVLIVKDAGGQDHHLELDVRLIEAAVLAGS